MTPFADGGPRSILVLDNAKIHHSAELTEMCLDAGILSVYLPPYLCDYNPIETSFAVLKQYIKKNGALIDAYAEQGGFELFLRDAVEAQNGRGDPGALFRLADIST